MNEPLIQASGLVRSYANGLQVIHALDNISLSIEVGETVALVGRSGSGKSTLINILSGLDQPNGGTLLVDGQNISSMNSDELAEYRRHTVGLVFQSFHLVPSLSALANVELPLVLAGWERRRRRERAEGLLEEVGLSPRAHHLPSELSGGEQQRVAIARALVMDPPILLADEPAGNLDSNNAHAVMNSLMGARESEPARTVIMVTHDEAMAKDYVSRLIRMSDGTIVDGTAPC